jgi:hypothetical protein
VIGQSIDTTRWTPTQLAVLYRELPNGRLMRGSIISLHIAPDGTAELELKDECRSMYRKRARFGTGNGQWEFVTPNPDIESLLAILTGRTKPGAPLPDKKKKNAASDDGFFDPLDPRPEGDNSKAAAKNT